MKLRIHLFASRDAIDPEVPFYFFLLKIVNCDDGGCGCHQVKTKSGTFVSILVGDGSITDQDGKIMINRHIDIFRIYFALRFPKAAS